MNETLLYAIIIIPCLVIAIVFHEVAHGWAALALGDPTAKEQKRLSFNPIRHVDPVGTVLVPGLLAIAQGPIFGWAKPVPVMKNRLRNPRYGMMAVAAAGPGMNLLLALIGAICLGVLIAYASSDLGLGGGGSSEAAGDTLDQGQEIGMGVRILLEAAQFFIMINVFLALFNLLPIPPFDGSHIVEGLLPPHLARKYEEFRKYGMLAFFGLVALSWFAPSLGIVENVILPPVLYVSEMFIGVAEMVALSMTL